DDKKDATPEKPTTTTAARKPAPTFEPGTTMDTIQEKGKIVVGTKFDQRGFGLKNPTSGEVEGFDAEIAKLIAAGIFGGEADDVTDKIEFVESVSKNREPFIQEGKVDIVIATYTINDVRKEVVDFAGPYFVAQQDILTKKSDTSINQVSDLNGKKVCTATGSTSEKNLRAKAPRAQLTLFSTYSECAEALTDGRVVAVSTDNAILAGIANDSQGAFKLVKAPFSDEPYGIGLKKGDEPFREFLNDRLEQVMESGEWAEAFEDTLGAIGLDTPTPPEVDRYQADGAGTSDDGSTTSSSGGSTSSTVKRSTTSTTRKPASSSTTARPSTTTTTVATTMTTVATTNTTEP
ncbi:MAG TPA: glutamate ABC transporter substrate-binding protein, partial [Acidimicrobiales bacterium]|nr:glutamate ABC transporter substrate-binding protein [Acidimicrobiales bacterium]